MSQDKATPAIPHKATRYKFPSNLPALFTQLVGREQEIKAASTLLLQADMRILTFTGTGGIGKTRLAIQIATELETAFSDGICFVSLAPINDPALVIPAIAHALGLQGTVDSSPQEQIQDYLRDRNFLLLLDNFEQVSEAAPALSELLVGCPALRCLVTSRVPLHIAAEHVFVVSSLTLPDLTVLPSIEILAEMPAINLFIQSARMVQPGFHLTHANAPAVAAICAQLDGLPLAVELAAARINLLPPQALLKRLENSLNVLTSNADGRHSRHQTMRNTIQWSYDLLSIAEQRLFQRLAIFMDGFTLQAAEALYTYLDGSSAGVLDGLSSLIEKNLLRSPEHDEEDPRPGMLETIRAFGLEMLQASDAYTAVKHAHMQYFLSLAEEASTYMQGPQEAEWKQRLERDLANLRAVMQLSLATGKQERELALRLGIALKSFWLSCGYFREGKTFLEQVLAGCEGSIDIYQASAMLVVVHFAFLFCEYAQAQHLLEVCQTYYGQQNDMEQLAFITFRLGWLANLQIRFVEARRLYEEASTFYKELHNEKMLNTVRYHRAFLALGEGDYQRSQELLEECLLYQKTLGLYRDIAATLGDMAQLRRLSSVIPPVEEMDRLLSEAMLYAKKAEDQNVIVALQHSMAWVAFLRGNLDEAHQLVDKTIAFYQEAGKLQSMGHYLELRGRIYCAQGKYEEALVTLEESVVQAHKQNDIDTMASAMIELAYLAVEQSHYARAIRLLGADEAMRAPSHLPTHPFESLHRDHVITIARAVLGREIFEQLWNEGRTLLPLDALVASDALPIKSKSTAVKNLSYPSGLTRREVDVLRLVAQGFTDVQVAEQLVISPRTVTTHLTSIYNKLQINTRSAATNFAVKNHLA